MTKKRKLSEIFREAESRGYTQIFGTYSTGPKHVCAYKLVLEEAGDEFSDLVIEAEKLGVRFVAWNDRERLTFPQIAERLEALGL